MENESIKKLMAVCYIAMTIEDETGKLPIEFLNLVQNEKTFAANSIKAWDLQYMRRKYGYSGQKEIFRLLESDLYSEDDVIVSFKKDEIRSYASLDHLTINTDKSLDEILDVASEFIETETWEALLRYCSRYYADAMKLARVKTIMLDFCYPESKIALVNKLAEGRQELFLNNQESLLKIADLYFDEDYMKLIDFLIHSKRYSSYDSIIEVRLQKNSYPYIYSWENINDIPLLSDLGKEEIDQITDDFRFKVYYNEFLKVLESNDKGSTWKREDGSYIRTVGDTTITFPDLKSVEKFFLENYRLDLRRIYPAIKYL